MKKLLAMALALLMVAVLLPVTAMAEGTIADQAALKAAVDCGETNFTLGEGAFTLYNVNATNTQNKTLVITGSGTNTVFSIGKIPATETGEYNADYSFEGSDVTFVNMRLNVGTGNYKGIVRAKSLTFENCAINGCGSYWGVGPVVFKNCTFNSTGEYNLWLYSGESFSFENCTFNSDVGKFINAYKEQRVDSQVSFTGCDFKYTGNGTPSKPAVCLKSHTGIVWNVSFTGCTSKGAVDEAPGSSLYSVEDRMNTETIVTIDNTEVWKEGKVIPPEEEPTNPGTITIIVPSTPTSPEFLSGANQIVGVGAKATFRIDKDFVDFMSVAVDGITLDKTQYKAWSGSTYVELLSSYMKTLSEGTHTLSAYFNGATATTAFTISKTVPAQQNPATGANDFVGAAAALAVVSLLGIAAVTRKK